METEAAESVWPPHLADEKVKRTMSIANAFDQWTEASGFHELGIKEPVSEQEGAAIQSLLMVHEHQRSVLRLVAEALYGSAAALMRPSFESYARGLWLQHATKEEMKQFQLGGNPKVERMLRVVADRTDHKRFDGLMDTWEQSKASLNGYVHGSYQALLRQVPGIEVPHSEVGGIVRFTTQLALNTTFELLDLAKRRPPDGDSRVRNHMMSTMQQDLLFLALGIELAESLPTVSTVEFSGK